MFITLFAALFSTFVYLNILYSDYIGSKVNPYNEGKLSEKDEAKLKLGLLFAMAANWALYYTLSNAQ